MHGSAVLSLLAGKETGTAPEAEIYYYAHAAWKADQTTHAECLYRIIEKNETLPDDKKIRMVGFSDNIDSSEINEAAFKEAVKACEDAGIMVWFCGEYAMASFVPYSDKNNPQNLLPDGAGPDLVYVPTAGCTTAATEFNNRYIYWGNGGAERAVRGHVLRYFDHFQQRRPLECFRFRYGEKQFLLFLLSLPESLERASKQEPGILYSTAGICRGAHGG